MARAGLQDHPKFRRLVYLLGEPVPHVVGYLECMWEVAYQRGNPTLGDRLDVELAAQYPGDQGKLVQALIDSKFVDEENGLCLVHDLISNAPDYVKKRMRRSN